MQMPSVATDFKDEQKRVVFRVIAYRAVSPQEGQFAIARYLQQKKGKVKPNTLVQIITLLGMHD